MNETLTTRQLRLFALLLGVVIIAGGYWMVVRKHSSSPTTASSTPVSTTPTSTTPSKTHTHTATPPARKLAKARRCCSPVSYLRMVITACISLV